MENIELGSRSKLKEALNKKLNVLRYQFITRNVINVEKDFFYTSIESGVTYGKKTFKMIDLAKEFESDVVRFAEVHGYRAYNTYKGYCFEKIK